LSSGEILLGKNWGLLREKGEKEESGRILKKWPTLSVELLNPWNFLPSPTISLAPKVAHAIGIQE